MRGVVMSSLAGAASLAALLYGCGNEFGAACVDECTSDASIDTGPADGAGGDVTTAEGGGEGGGGDGGADGDAMQSRDSRADGADGFDGFFCDPNATPKDNACVVTDAFGIFVSAGAAVGGTGTKAAPLLKIQDGIAAAKAAGKRLYVCTGTYTDNAVIDASKDGVKIYGGLDCTTWTYAATNAVKVAPTAGYALKLDTLTTGTHIEDVEFDGPNGGSPGASSIAVFANAAANVSFKRVVIKAGNGVAGTDGTTGSNYNSIGRSDAKIAGKGAMGPNGGALQTCDMLCANNIRSTGGSGGSGGSAPGGGSDGAPGLGAGNGGTALACATTNIGGQNGNAAPAAMGGAAASTPGILSATGWAVSVSSGGTVAGPGQGGGGGGGGLDTMNMTGGGGGGACGGCGGGAGTAGTAGGSSFALMSFNSTIALEACALTGGNAQNGGKGGDGQVGQPGGYGGVAAQAGCPGGAGGTGGAGGGGAGGAGGISAAIFYKGTAPTTTNGTTAVKGTGAVGGTHGANGNPLATDGLTTASQDVMMAP